MKRAWAVFALMMLLPAVAFPLMQGTPGTAVAITGPERLAATTAGSYNVKLFGPADIRWGFWVNVSGANREDAKLESPDGTADSSRSYIMSQTVALPYPEFNFTLTAPGKAGTLLITVTATAMEGAGAAGQTATSRWSVDVKTRRDVQLNSTVRNTGDVTVQNLKVAFMVKLGGVWTYITNETVSELTAGQVANVSTTWDSTLVGSGEFSIRIVVDPDKEKFEYSGSGGISEKRVVLRDAGSKEAKPYNYNGIYFLVVLGVAGAVFYAWYRKKKIV